MHKCAIVDKDTVIHFIHEFAQNHGIDPNNQLLVTDLVLSIIQTHRLHEYKKIKTHQSTESEQTKLHFMLMKIAQLVTKTKEAFEMSNLELLQLCHRNISADLKSLHKEEGRTTQLSNALTKEMLGPDGKDKLESMNAAFLEDFKLRRKMMLTRCDVTLKSFMWSPNVNADKLREAEIALKQRRSQLREDPKTIDVDSIFLVNDKQIKEQYQSVSRASKPSLVKQITIGNVPDRGGRVTEMEGSRMKHMHPWVDRKATQKSSSKRKMSREADRSGRC